MVEAQNLHKVWDVAEWRVRFTRDKNKEERKLYLGMQRLTREIFAASLVKHHSIEEAMMAVYLTGLYHAASVIAATPPTPRA